jgi:hypothetical protein
MLEYLLSTDSIGEVLTFTTSSNNTVLDFGRPSISGSIRSIKMYSWA